MALIVVASTTATAGTSTTASRTPTAPAGSARTALGFGTRFVDIQGAPAEFFAIESGDRFFGFGGIGHFHKCKSSGTAGVAIGHYANLIDFAVRFKQGSQLCFGGAVREVANKKLLHGFPFPVSQRKTSGFVGEFC
jgi:hypothetical protein